MTNKHHYRNVFKSDHLGSADLEDMIEQGKKLIFTIKEVKQEIGAKVAGKKGDFNIAYFNEPIKPLVLNATNSKQVKAFAGGTPFVEDWKNILVELYIDENVKAVAGGTTQGVRIKPIQPNLSSNKPIFTEANFAPAKAAGADRSRIEAGYQLTDEMWNKYVEYEPTKE